jgi:DNA polymerase-3 subunit delta
MTTPRIVLFWGEDSSLVRGEATKRARALVGSEHSPGDPGYDVFDAREVPLERAILAFSTRSIFGSERVVLIHALESASKDSIAQLAQAISDGPQGAVVMGYEGSHQPPAALVSSCKKVGEVVSVDPGRGQQRSSFIASAARQRGVHLEPAALSLLASHAGEDSSLALGVLEVLASAFSPGETVTVAQLECFLGEAGSVPSWNLTDAIDAGNLAEALEQLGRMMRGGGLHPLAVLAILHKHFRQALALDGLDGISQERAGELLGIKSTFVAGKALARSRSLGTEGLAEAFRLMSRADLDIKGGSGLPPELIMEVLVARLSRLSRRRSPSRRPVPRRTRSG